MPTHPFYSGGASSSGMTPPDGSAQRLAIDNIIRRELRVGDANDPMQVAQALLARYKDTPRAQAISQEAKGLPFLQSAAMPFMVPQAPTSSDAELQQAKDDVDRDLHELTTNSLLKDVTPEIQGWAQAVRSAIQEGTTAARFALDPRQRDKAFAIRRQLGDYARMVRLVGALTPTLNSSYRAFAQSLDEVASVLLVLMGEALANVGFAGGRFLLQAPYSELQVRRDAVIFALRNLIGATQQAFGPNDWPRGLDAYRRLFDALEEQGQGDLRALLLEIELARTMDELIQRAAHGTVQGLRALGSTAQLDLQRFRRLIVVGRRVVDPESPPLTTFLEALQLFVDAFEPSGGFRLLRIARPPILFYGLYGSDEIDPAERRLTQLLIRRGILAGQLDCYMGCNCDEGTALCQIVLDKVLYDIDRAIDLYAVGEQELGPPEIRAAAYSFVIDAARTFGCNFSTVPVDGTLTLLQLNLRPLLNLLSDWASTSTAIQFEQNRANNNPVFNGSGFRDLMMQELCIQRDAEVSWQNLVETMVPNCIPMTNVFGPTGRLTRVINRALNAVISGVTVLNTSVQDNAVDCGIFEPTIPPHFETSLAGRVYLRTASGGQISAAQVLNAAAAVSSGQTSP